MATFSDDQQISGCQNKAAGLENEFTVGKAKFKITNPPNTPLEESKLKVLVELTGKARAKERCGLDLVIVLDFTSIRNKPDGLRILKKATELVIKTLNPIDRVSIVTLSSTANRMCALRQINQESLEDIINLVNGITPDIGGENISDGLEMALQVLNGRRFTESRSVGIILMSNSDQNRGGNATKVEVGCVPVYTFSFGTSDKKSPMMPRVLEAIARNSNGGTFTDVRNTKDLSVAFAQCFAGLLTVAVKGLKLIMSPENMSIIENVNADDYEQSRDDSTVAVTFGDLYDNETRQVIIDLILPPVARNRMVRTHVLQVSYLYSNKLGTKELKSPQTPPVFASTKRKRNVTIKGKVKPSNVKKVAEVKPSAGWTNITKLTEGEDDRPAPRRRRRTDVGEATKPSSKIYYERQGFTTRDDVKEQR